MESIVDSLIPEYKPSAGRSARGSHGLQPVVGTGFGVKQYDGVRYQELCVALAGVGCFSRDVPGRLCRIAAARAYAQSSSEQQSRKDVCCCRKPSVFLFSLILFRFEQSHDLLYAAKKNGKKRH